MKTKTNILMLTLLGLLMMSCASSSQVGKTSSWSDEIYGSPAKSQTAQLAQSEVKYRSTEKDDNSSYANLEQKYADVIEINMDSIKNDTVIYKAEDTNPYTNILSESYQESYERRLRGQLDPYYRMENWSTYLSDDYRYAQAYDPYFYNIIVMGSQVWVEPRDISSMFGWPRSGFNFGIGFGWNWGYWGWHRNNLYSSPYSYLNDPWYSSPWHYSSIYWNGWYDSQYYWLKYTSNSNEKYFYGRRGAGTNNYSTYDSRTNTKTDENQTVLLRRSEGNTTSSNPIVSSRRTQTRVTPTYESNGQSNGRRRTIDSDQVSTETRRMEVTNSRRVSDRPTREIGVSEPTRRNYNQSNGRTRTSSDYSSRRTDGSQNSNVTGTNRTSSGSRSTTPTYNRPERVSSPSSTSTSNDSYKPSGSSNRSSSSGSSYSGSSNRSSSSSSSSSSSNSSSGSSSNSRRR